MRATVKITTLFALLFCSLSSTAQILDRIGEAKQKAYEKKVNKSPAKDEIIKLDQALEELERYADWTGAGIYKANRPAPWAHRGSYTPSNEYTKFVKNYLIAKEMIPLVKEKDPDWKIEEQEERFTPFTAKYEEATTLQKKYEELEASYEMYDKLYEKKIEQFSRSWERCGYSSDYSRMTADERLTAARNFNSFVLGTEDEDLNWTQLQSDIPKVREITAAYKTEYELKGGEKSSYIDLYGLERIDLKGKSEYKGVNEYKKEFVSYFSDNDTEYDKAVTLTDMPKKLKYSTADLAIAEAWLFIFPEDAQLKEVHNKILKYRETLVSKYKSEVAVSDYHVEIVSGTFFSNHKINFGSESEADYKTTFTSTEPIYITNYHTEKYNNCHTQFYVTDKTNGVELRLNYHPEGFKENCKNMTSYHHVPLIPNSFEEIKSDYSSVLELLMYLKDLENDKIVLEISKKEITIDLSEGTQKYKDLYDQLLNYRRSNLHPPKPQMSFSLSMKKACEQQGFKETIVKVIPTSSDWVYEKNYLGIILSREIDAVILFKDANGKCFLREVSIYQNKIESGFASPVISHVSSYYHEYLNNNQGRSHAAEDDDYRVYCRCQ